MDHPPRETTNTEKRVTTGQLSSTARRSDGGRALAVVTVILCGVALMIGAIWMYRDTLEPRQAPVSASRSLESRQVETPAPPPTGLSAPARGPATPSVAATPASDRPQDPARAGEVEVYFAFDRATLTPTAKERLQAQASLMRAHQAIRVILKGYTDRRGSPEYNRELAMKRARAVEQYLVELGVPSTTIQVFSGGEDEQLCTVRPAACQQHKRRVHVAWEALTASLSTAASPETTPDREGSASQGRSAKTGEAPEQGRVETARAEEERPVD